MNPGEQQYNMSETMMGNGGTIPIQLPSNQLYEYQYVTVMNMTDNSIALYPPGVDYPTTQAPSELVPQYSSRTIAILPAWRSGFMVVWTNPNGTALTTPKNFNLYFTEDDIGMNASYAPSFSQIGVGNYSVTGATTGAAMIDIGTNNPWLKQGTNSYTLLVSNTGAYTVNYQVLASLDNGQTWPIQVVAPIELASGVSAIKTDTNYYSAIKVQAEDYTAGNHSTLTVQGNSIAC